MSKQRNPDIDMEAKQGDDTQKGEVGARMYGWAQDLYPICRSITGNGVRETLHYIKEQLPDLEIHEVPSGTQAFDWTVPDEWNITEAYIETQSGERIVDFADHNLHVLGYSEPVDAWLDLEDLDAHLYSLPEQPDVIPYVTSYYKRRWGFCLPHRQRKSLKPGPYHVVIKSTLAPGHLTYGELLLPGSEPSEILLSTYVCHPSMGNNELSGPVVTAALAQWLSSQQTRRHSYRIVFIPETIGSIVYLSRNIEAMQQNTIAGFVVTCIGDDRDYSMLTTPYADTLADRVSRHVLQNRTESFTEYSFLERGSDERQYCSPLVGLPVVNMMRSKYATYPEYHTSADDLSVISPKGLEGGYDMMRNCLHILENNQYYKVGVPCEPQLGKRGLYPTISDRDSGLRVRDMMNVLAYCDGTNDLIGLAERTGLYAGDVIDFMAPLIDNGLVAPR